MRITKFATFSVAAALWAACGGTGANRPEPTVEPAPAENTIAILRLPRSAVLPEMISAIAAADWGPTVNGQDCVFIWGQVQPGPGTEPLRIVSGDGSVMLSGHLACDDGAIESALPLPSGVLMGWRRDSLVMAHGSDLSESVVFDDAYRTSFRELREAAGEDPRLYPTYVAIVVLGNEEIMVPTALTTFSLVSETFGAAMLPVGGIPRR